MPIKTVITPNNLGSEFDLGVTVTNKITLKTASDTLAGKVALAVLANYPQHTNDIDAVTPAYVKSAIDAVVAGTSNDKFLSGASLNGVTGILTLTVTNGTNVTVDLSSLFTVTITSTNAITTTGNGTSVSPLTNTLKVDPLVGNLVVVTTAGVKVDPASIPALATIDVQDAFGVHLYNAFA